MAQDYLHEKPNRNIISQKTGTILDITFFYFIRLPLHHSHAKVPLYVYRLVCVLAGIGGSIEITKWALAVSCSAVFIRGDKNMLASRTM